MRRMPVLITPISILHHTKPAHVQFGRVHGEARLWLHDGQDYRQLPGDLIRHASVVIQRYRFHTIRNARDSRDNIEPKTSSGLENR